MWVVAGAGNDAINFGDETADDLGAVTVLAGAGDDAISFGEILANGGNTVIVSAGTGNDNVTFRDGFTDDVRLGIPGDTLVVSVTGGQGDDVIFVDGDVDAITSGVSGPSSVIFDGCEGRDTITMGSAINTTINGGIGADVISVGDNSGTQGSFLLNGGNGDDQITIGSGFGGNSRDPVFVNAGEGDNVVTFSDNTGRYADYVVITSGTGDDTFVFGNLIANDTNTNVTEGAFLLSTGAGHDNVTIGSGAAYFTGKGTSINATRTFTVETGEGDDVITIGNHFSAGVRPSGGSISTIDAGEGDDTVTIGGAAGQGSGNFSVVLGAGADTASIGGSAGSGSISLGHFDGAADTLTIEGSVEYLTIHNWQSGDDTIELEAVDGVFWVADGNFFNGALFESSDGEVIEVTFTNGADVMDILTNIHCNDWPSFTAGTTILPDAAFGSGGAAYSVDLNPLFGDANIANGDVLTVTATGFPAGFTVTDGVLTAGNDMQFAGAHSITVTATDLSGASVSQEVTVDAGINNDFGDNSVAFFSSASVTGSTGSDVLTLGVADLDGGANLYVNSLGGDDTVSIGAISTFDFEQSIAINLGDGADTLTFTAGGANTSVDLGADMHADTIVFTSSATEITVSNFDHTMDSVDVVNTAGWTVADDGTDTTLSNGGDSIVFLGVTGLTDASDFIM